MLTEYDLVIESEKIESEKKDLYARRLTQKFKTIEVTPNVYYYDMSDVNKQQSIYGFRWSLTYDLEKFENALFFEFKNISNTHPDYLKLLNDFVDKTTAEELALMKEAYIEHLKEHPNLEIDRIEFGIQFGQFLT